MGNGTRAGIAQLSAGDVAQGRATLMQALAAGEPAAPIWYALSLAADSPEEGRDCLQHALQADPLHELARWELARLSAARRQPDASQPLRARALALLRRTAGAVAGLRRGRSPAAGPPDG